MQILRKFTGVMDPNSQTQTLSGKRQVQCQCSSPNTDRDGDIIVQSGIDLSQYRRNPVVLWQHSGAFPIARAIEIGLNAQGNLSATVQFPDEGKVQKADEVYALIQSGIVNAVSIGFRPTEAIPLDKGNPTKGPKKILKCTLLEFSFVSIPSNADAVIIERGAKWEQEEILRRRRRRDAEVLKLAADTSLDLNRIRRERDKIELELALPPSR